MMIIISKFNVDHDSDLSLHIDVSKILDLKPIFTWSWVSQGGPRPDSSRVQIKSLNILQCQCAI